MNTIIKKAALAAAIISAPLAASATDRIDHGGGEAIYRLAVRPSIHCPSGSRPT